MRGCGLNIFGRGIYARYLGPHARQWLTQQPRTAANIKRRLAQQRITRLAVTAKIRVDGGSNEAKPNGIQLVQHGA